MESPATMDSDTGQGTGSGSELSTRKRPQTVSCFLCGGTQIYPGPRYENHLINEHGVLDIDYMIAITLYKQKNGYNPSLEDPCNSEDRVSETKNEKAKFTKEKVVSKSDAEVQTNLDIICSRCTEYVEPTIESYNGIESSRLNNKLKLKLNVRRDEEYDNSSDKIENTDDENEEGYPAILAATEFSDNDENLPADMNCVKRGDSSWLDGHKRKAVGEKWSPNAFSSTFTCYFCREQFRKDYKLKLHLMLNHKNEDSKEYSKAMEVLTQAKLDGCVHHCKLCNSNFNSHSNISRHLQIVHQMSRAQYVDKYGSSEVVSRIFKCELCKREIKHTRTIISSHMKSTHLISWREYQEILLRLKDGIDIGNLPMPELFDCNICGASVKYRREHLRMKHKINEEIYDEIITKKNRGEDISQLLFFEKELFDCIICGVSVKHRRDHLNNKHQITNEIYDELIAKKNQGEDISEILPEPNWSSLSPTHEGKLSPNPVSINSGTSSENTSLSTDLRCYFGCGEMFKKDFQLRLHLKLNHQTADPKELRRAFQAADEEIALTRRSASIFQCAICPKTYNDGGSFYCHIQKKHNIQWKDYKDHYGSCEVDSAPFECKICSRIVKYDRNTIHTHLKHVHGITWVIYLDRIRKMRQGEVLDDLPSIGTFKCMVCNVSVKHIRQHLRNVHKITETKYNELIKEECIKTEHEDTIINTQNEECQMNMSDAVDMLAKSEDTQPIHYNRLIQRNGTTHTISNYMAPDSICPKPPKSDFQDKANKKCSSCAINFISRRSFIEHCASIHNIKFRTKSGASISVPTISDTSLQQQQTLKRKADITEENNAKFQRNHLQNQVFNPLKSDSGRLSEENCRNVLMDKTSPPKIQHIPETQDIVHNVHNMTINAKHYCDYCPKGFSSSGNKNRHAKKCAAILNATGTKRNASAEASMNTNQSDNCPESSFILDRKLRSSNLDSTKPEQGDRETNYLENDHIYDPQIGTQHQESPLACPYPKCYAHKYTYEHISFLEQHLVQDHNLSIAHRVSPAKHNLQFETQINIAAIKTECEDKKNGKNKKNIPQNNMANNVKNDQSKTQAYSNVTKENQRNKMIPLIPATGLSTMSKLYLDTKLHPGAYNSKKLMNTESDDLNITANFNEFAGSFLKSTYIEKSRHQPNYTNTYSNAKTENCKDIYERGAQSEVYKSTEYNIGPFDNMEIVESIKTEKTECFIKSTSPL